MNPLALPILRRLAIWAFVLAGLLLLGPPLLNEFGVLGPGVQAELEQAWGALDAARAYGATEAEPHFEAAFKELERARDLARKGQARQARHAAIHAKNLAVDSQRIALMNREEDHRRAEHISLEIDKALNELEDLYSEVTPGLEKNSVSGLLSEMKVARQAGAALSLAYEQANYTRVIQEEKETMEILTSVKRKLESARSSRRAGKPGPT